MSFNGKTTLEKGGRDPPDVSVEYIVDKLLSYLYNIDKFRVAQKKPEDKYGIIKEHDNCWPVDDIKRAWGKTQRMDEEPSRKRHWSLVIMMQVTQKQQARHLFQMKAGKRREIGEDGLGSTCDIDQDFVNSKRRKEHPEDIFSQSTAEQGTMAAAGGDEQHSGGNPQISGSGQTGGVSQGCAGTPNTVRSQSTGNNRGGFNREDGPAGAVIQRQNNNGRETIYIRVPFLQMTVYQYLQVETPPPVENDRSTYKLIDGLPETENILNEIRRRKSYVMSFNHLTRNANWVYEILNKKTLAENPVSDSFGAPYQRGHLAAAANHRWCQEAFDDVNMIENIVPQHKLLNTGPWSELENSCRKTAKAQHIRNVHVYSGPLYRRVMNPRVIHGKLVPSHFFKVIIEEDINGTVNQPQCYQTPNGNLTGPVEDRAVNILTTNVTRITIDQIQNDSMLEFIRPNAGQNAVAKQITASLHGADRSRQQHTAEIQTSISLTERNQQVSSRYRIFNIV